MSLPSRYEVMCSYSGEGIAYMRCQEYERAEVAYLHGIRELFAIHKDRAFACDEFSTMVQNLLHSYASRALFEMDRLGVAIRPFESEPVLQVQVGALLQQRVPSGPLEAS